MRFLDYIKAVKRGYVPDWYHQLMIAELERVARGEQDLLNSGPPGCGKTELHSILFPSWLICEDPGTHIILLSNSDPLARMASGNILRLIQSPAFQDLQPLELDKATENQFIVRGNDGRPTLHSAGINGQLTGHRAKFLIYDDLTKSLADAYSETVSERTWQNFNSAAETRLLPDGRIVGVQTRWSLHDTHGRLLRRALESPDSRQFVYLNLAATNNGTESYIQNTKTKKTEYLSAYKSLATRTKQPYSFSAPMLRGKRADLGPVIYSALYMGNPINSESQMFPPDCWRVEPTFNTDDLGLIVSAWDTAAKDKNNNDPSCNVVVARRHAGDFIVLDVAEFRLSFDKLLPVVLERHRVLLEKFGQLPMLCVEDASSGTQLLDIVRTQFPGLPFVAAKPVRSKIVRAEGVTPFTAARSVALLAGEWNAAFIADMANFPASDRDHSVDAFVHGMKCFLSSGVDFRKGEYSYIPDTEDPDVLPPGFSPVDDADIVRTVERNRRRQRQLSGEEFVIDPLLPSFDFDSEW